MPEGEGEREYKLMHCVHAGIKNVFQLTPSCVCLCGLTHKALLSLAPSVFCEPLLDEKLGAEADPRERNGPGRGTAGILR